MRDVLLISQHDAAARDTEKVHARLGHVSQRLNHAGTRFAEWRAGAGSWPGRRDQSPRPVRFANMARHYSVEIAVVIAQGRVEPHHCELSLVAAARPLGHRLGVRRRAYYLDRAEYFDLSWAESTAVRVDHGLSDVTDLDMAVLGEACQQ